MQPALTYLQQVFGQYPFHHALRIDQQDCMEILIANTAHDLYYCIWKHIVKMGFLNAYECLNQTWTVTVDPIEGKGMYQ